MIYSNVYSGNTRLTDMSLMHTNKNFIAFEVCPEQPAGLPTGEYYVYDRSHQRDVGVPVVRQPGSVAANVEHGLTTQTYFSEEYALEESIPLAHIDFADPAIDRVGDAVAMLMERIKIRIERNFTTLIDATGDWTTSHSTTLSGGDQWDQAGSTPLVDIETGREQMESVLGSVEGEAVAFCDSQTWSKLRLHSDVLNALKYTGVGRASPQQFADLIEADAFYVGRSVYNTAIKGQTDSISRIWPKGFWWVKRPVSRGLRQIAWAWHFQRPLEGAGQLRQIVETRMNDDNISIQVRVRRTTGFNPVTIDGSSKLVAGYFIASTIS